MVLQVTGDQLKQVLQEMRGKLTPEEGRALVGRALRDRDQADSDKWQVLLTPSQSSFWLICRTCDPTCGCLLCHTIHIVVSYIY